MKTKRVVIGYKDKSDPESRVVLYAGNDNAAALDAAKGAEGVELAVVHDTTTSAKRVFFDKPKPDKPKPEAGPKRVKAASTQRKRALT